MAAASVFHGFTAHYLAHDVGHLGPGVTCLVHAASGGIGQLLIQLGKRLGATVYATTSTQEKAQVARERGADLAVLYDNGRFAEAMREATQGRGVDVEYSTRDRQGDLAATAFHSATRKKRGLVVAYGSVSGSVTDLDPIELGEAGSLFLTRPRLADHLPDAATTRRRAADIFTALLDGSLTIEIAGRYTLANVAAAHAALEERRTIGKPILEIS